MHFDFVLYNKVNLTFEFEVRYLLKGVHIYPMWLYYMCCSIFVKCCDIRQILCSIFAENEKKSLTLSFDVGWLFIKIDVQYLLKIMWTLSYFDVRMSFKIYNYLEDSRIVEVRNSIISFFNFWHTALVQYSLSICCLWTFTCAIC